MMSQNAQYEMKDSGVEWIGEIPKEWKLKSAKHCVDIHHGSDPTTEGDIPVYGSGAESFKTCGEYKEGPTVLIGRKGATLHIPHYITGKYWNVDTAFDVKAHSDFSLKFYYYLAICFDYKFYISQTTLPGMTQTNYRNMPIPVPLLIEQQSIASYLDEKCAAIDEIIAEAKATIDEYKSWKASVIFEAVTKGLNPNAEMKDSGVEWIGRIPKAWYSTRLKFLLKRPLQYGANSSGVEYNEKLPRYIRITDITKDNRLTDTDMLSLPMDEASDYILDDKDILLARSGATSGKAFLYRSKYGLSAFAGYLIRAKINNYKALPEYVYYSTLGSGYDQWKSSIALQATIPNIGANKYNEYTLPVPPLPEQQSIATYLDEKCAAIDGVIAEKEALIVELESYKKSLIFETVTGKRRVC